VKSQVREGFSPRREVDDLSQDALRTRFGRGSDLKTLHHVEIALKWMRVCVKSHRGIPVSKLLLDRFDVGAPAAAYSGLTVTFVGRCFCRLSLSFRSDCRLVRRFW
jgi:hypothetical protein